MNIAIKKLRPDTVIPQYHTAHAAAMDVAVAIDEPITLQAFERQLVPTGFAMAIPVGYEAQIRPRSGLSLKHGIALASGVATIDADYRGEIMVSLINLSQEVFIIEPGMRVAQRVIAACERAEWTEVDELETTQRGEGGFGSTGVK